MKHFILGFITMLIIGIWVCLAVTGILSVKTVLLVPVGIVIGGLFTIGLISFMWNK